MELKFKLKIIIPFLAILFIASSKIVFGQNFIVKEDLRLDWVFYDDEGDVMLPFLDNGNESPVAMHLPIDLDYAKEAYLMINIPANSSLFLENKFVKHYDANTIGYFSLDSLNDIFDTEILQFTLYKKRSFENPTDAKIGFIHNTFNSGISVNPIAERDVDNRSNYIKIIILVLFTFFVVLYTLFPSELLAFLSLHTLFTFRYTSTALTKYRSFTKTQTLVIIYQASLIAGILIIFLIYYDNPLGQAFFLKLNPIVGWLIIFGIVLILMFLKFVLISIISILFRLTNRINFYFIEFLRMAMIFYSIMFVLLGYTVINQFYLVNNLLDSLIFIVVFFNLVRFIFLFFKFRRSISMKSLHLFSYLCTTELIPIIIGLKFFLK